MRSPWVKEHDKKMTTHSGAVARSKWRGFRWWSGRIDVSIVEAEREVKLAERSTFNLDGSYFLLMLASSGSPRR